MPQELLGIIATDPALTNRDRKQVRLACRDLEAAITPFVFKRIVVSKLRADRDAFLSVAADPRLAACVEEVVWLELGEFPGERFFSSTLVFPDSLTDCRM